VCYVLAVVAGAAGVFLLRRAGSEEAFIDERLVMMGLAGVALAFAMLMVGAAEVGRRGVLLWRAEDGRLVGEVPHSGEQVWVPVQGPARVEKELRALSNGVHAEQYSVWLSSPVLGPVRLLGGGGQNVDEVRARWAAASFSGGGGEIPVQPPPGSGVSLESDGTCRLAAGWGGLALPFLAAGLLMSSPVVVIPLMRGSGLSPVPGAVGAIAVALTLLTVLYAFSHWELRAGAEGVLARRHVGPLPLGSPRKLPGDLRLDLSRAPRVAWVDGTGQPRLRAVAVARGSTLAGVLWLTAVLRQHDRVRATR
jgi:hypothetical protein